MSGPLALGPSRGRVVLRTYREGVGAQVGHDLVLEFAAWSALATLPEGAAAEGAALEIGVPRAAVPAALEARIDLSSLSVRGGTGGVKALTDRDRRDIAGNAGRAFDTGRFPEAYYRSTTFTPTADGGFLDGVLTLHGVERPLRLTLTRLQGGGCRATAVVRQTDHGIKPYSAFFGALKLRDAVDLEIAVDLRPDPGSAV